MELSPASIRAARHGSSPSLRAVAGNALDLPFRDRSVDAVVAFEVVEHLPDVARALDEMLRVVRRPGYIIIGLPNHASLWTPIEDRLRGRDRRAFGVERGRGAWRWLRRNAGLAWRKRFSRGAEFLYREPILHATAGGDADAVYYAAPIDLLRFFRARCDAGREPAASRAALRVAVQGGAWTVSPGLSLQGSTVMAWRVTRRRTRQRIVSRSSLKTKSARSPASKCSVISLIGGRDGSGGSRNDDVAVAIADRRGSVARRAGRRHRRGSIAARFPRAIDARNTSSTALVGSDAEMIGARRQRLHERDLSRIAVRLAPLERPAGPEVIVARRGPRSTSRLSSRRSGRQINRWTFHAAASSTRPSIVSTSSRSRYAFGKRIAAGLYMPNTRVRGCRGSRSNISPSAEPPGSPSRSRIVGGRSTCEVGASETVIGPGSVRRLDEHHGLRRRDNRRQPHGGRAGNE